MNRILTAKPLTRAAFAPFGEVIEAEGARHYPINGGKCERYHDLARVEVMGTAARVLVNIFRGTPYAFPLALTMVERHPFGSQAFYPLLPQPFLVVVCEDKAGKPDTPRVFLTAPGQGVNYRRNIWHGVLTPIGAAQDFLVVDRGGEEVNIEEFFFDDPWEIRLPEQG